MKARRYSTVRITVTAEGDETLAELAGKAAALLPGYVLESGQERVRRGDPAGPGGRVHAQDRPAHVAFVRHGHEQIDLSRPAWETVLTAPRTREAAAFSRGGLSPAGAPGTFHEERILAGPLVS